MPHEASGPRSTFEGRSGATGAGLPAGDGSDGGSSHLDVHRGRSRRGAPRGGWPCDAVGALPVVHALAWLLASGPRMSGPGAGNGGR